MHSRCKPYYALILWLLLFFSCKKDVTSEYITDSPSRIVVESIFSPQKTWRVYIGRTYQFTESVPNFHHHPKDIEEAYIIEDGNTKIPLHYDEDVYAYVHDSFPKEGSHYKLVIKRKNKPDVIAEDTVPQKFEVEEVFGNVRTVKFFAESNDSQSCKQNFIKIKGDFNENTFIKIALRVIEHHTENFHFSKDIINQLKKRGFSGKGIKFWQNKLGWWNLGKYTLNPDLEVRYQDIYSDMEYWVLDEIIDKKTSEEWKKKNYNFKSAALYELRDILPIEYSQKEKRYFHDLYSNEIFFTKNKSFNGQLIGNLKNYKNSKLEILTPYYSDDTFFSTTEADAIRYAPWDYTENRVLLSHLSEDANRYLRDVQVQLKNKDSKFNPTIRVHSNVTNGLGIFAAKNESTVTMFYSNEKSWQ